MTNSIASLLHLSPVSRATTTKRHLSLDKSSWYFASLSSRARVRTAPFTWDALEHARPWGQSAPKCDVHSKLGPVMQWQAAGQHLNCPLVFGGDVNIHVPELRVASQSCPCLSANACEAAFSALYP